MFCFLIDLKHWSQIFFYTQVIVPAVPLWVQVFEGIYLTFWNKQTIFLIYNIAICASVFDCQLWSCSKATLRRGDNHFCLVISACKWSQMCLVMTWSQCPWLWLQTPLKQELTASDCLCQGSEGGPCSPLTLYQPLVTHRAYDDNWSIQVIHFPYVCHLSFPFVWLQDSLQDWTTKEADCL